MKTFLTLIAVLALGGAAYYYFVMRPAEEAASKPASVLIPPKEDTRLAPEPSSEPPSSSTEPGVTGLAEAPPSEPLPALMESDPAVLESLTAEIGDTAVTQYVVPENLVGRIVATVDRLTARQLPGQFLPVQPLGTPFEANVDLEPTEEITNEEGDVLRQYLADPVNTDRYTAYIEQLESLDTADMTALYRRYQPLFEEAYVGLGYPDGGFHSRLLEVIDHLLAAEPAPEPARLIKPEAYYLFVDPELESLTAGQKLMIRMGSSNAVRVKEKLRELRAALEQASSTQQSSSDPSQQ